MLDFLLLSSPNEHTKEIPPKPTALKKQSKISNPRQCAINIHSLCSKAQENSQVLGEIDRKKSIYKKCNIRGPRNMSSSEALKVVGEMNRKHPK